MSETEVTQEVEKNMAEELDTKGDPSAPAKSGMKSEPTHLKNDGEDLGSAVVKPTDKNPDATKKVSKVSDQVNKDANDGSLPKDNKPAGMKEEEAEIEGEEIAEDKAEDSEMNIDLSDDVKALVSTDADLSEEFKEKAATIFETAVKTRIKEQVKILEAQYDEKLSKETETVKEAMVEKVDSYLNYVVEEWMKENELAVERGIRTEIAEDFITGLKSLFKEHYIDVPEEKYDVLEAMTAEKDELEKKLNEEIAKNVELSKSNFSFSKEKIFSEASEGLADTESEKLKELAENIEFKDEQDFSKKLDTIKESYFPKAKSEPTASKEDVDSVVGDATLKSGSNEAMAAYTAAISNTLTKVKI